MSRKGKQNDRKILQQQGTGSTMELEIFNLQKVKIELQTAKIEREKATIERDTAKIKSKTAVLDMTCTVCQVITELMPWIAIIIVFNS